MALKNRIKGLRYIRAGDLLTNPRNWRTHSSAQQAALQAVLAEVGIAGALIACETDDGFELFRVLQSRFDESLADAYDVIVERWENLTDKTATRQALEAIT